MTLILKGKHHFNYYSYDEYNLLILQIRTLQLKKTSPRQNGVSFVFKQICFSYGILSHKNDEENKEEYKDAKNFYHEPPIGSYAPEILQDLAMAGLYVQGRVLHVCVDPQHHLFLSAKHEKCQIKICNLNLIRTFQIIQFINLAFGHLHLNEMNPRNIKPNYIQFFSFKEI